MLALEHGELLPENQVFHSQPCPGPKSSENAAKEKSPDEKHARSVSQIGCESQRRI